MAFSLRCGRYVLVGLLALRTVIATEGSGQDNEDAVPGLTHRILGKGDEEVNNFVRRRMEVRNAVAVLRGNEGGGGKRWTLFEELGRDEVLQHVLTFAAQSGHGKTSLTVYPAGYEKEVYDGKWTRAALRAWLMRVGYPLVNRFQTLFSPHKYLSHTEFQTILISRTLHKQDDELVKMLEPYAEALRDKVKFTFFSRVPALEPLADAYGIWSNNELLLLGDPKWAFKGSHTVMPHPPNYRLERLTQPRLEEFFRAYEMGNLSQYRYLTPPTPPPSNTTPVEGEGGILELAAWNFLDTVNDPASAVLVNFYSEGCDACEEYALKFVALGRRVRELRSKGHDHFSNLRIARLDQSKHQHTERIVGTPALRFWPAGQKNKVIEVSPQEVDEVLAFLEEQVTAHAEEEARGAEL